MRRLEAAKDHTTTRRPTAGFSLIELLIVVAVILIIAAIAIPNYLRSKMLANESSAVQNLRNIATAEMLYSTTYGIDFSNGLTPLSGSGVNPDQNNAELIDETLASGLKSGYIFTFAVLTVDAQGHPGTYSVAADPQSPGVTGQRHFYIEQTAVIRANASVPAGPNDPPIS